MQRPAEAAPESSLDRQGQVFRDGHVRSRAAERILEDAPDQARALEFRPPRHVDRADPQFARVHEEAEALRTIHSEFIVAIDQELKMSGRTVLVLQKAGDNTLAAMLATNGVTGMGSLRSLYSIGLSTPNDIAFVTFDEITAEDFFKPSVTSVVQPTFEMGARAVEVLLARIEEKLDPNAVQKVRLPATLTVRDSSRTPLPGGSTRKP